MNRQHIFTNRFRIVEPEDGQWGIKKNDSWTGMIGLLEDRVRIHYPSKTYSQ